MRSYGIYKVKERYQSYIIGRERQLYDLLKKDGRREVDRQQIHYLCEPLEEAIIDSAIISNLEKGFATIEQVEGEYRLTHPMKGSIWLSLSSHALHVNCDGSRMLDLDLFVALSASDNRFFAVMDDRREWGWLKPVKTADFGIGGESVSL
ncbi:sporulation inhibitor of replication protein SirA [Sporosarcina sp. 179-K 3D1 HS]|uniref:sporulation inhibitor of replication protein SirA n=1 Tax=Sporosarcina sp. 179-K 3D1 HS TaxID=3232169 RepID=UPI0039A20613